MKRDPRVDLTDNNFSKAGLSKKLSIRVGLVNSRNFYGQSKVQLLIFRIGRIGHIFGNDYAIWGAV